MKTDFEKAAKEYRLSFGIDGLPPTWVIQEMFFVAGCEHAYSIDRWISVADALPEKDSFALCYYGGIAPIVGCYKGKGMWLCDEDNEMWVAGEEITHWMPLPKPPSTP